MGQEGPQRWEGHRRLTMGSWLPRPQEGAAPDLSSGEDNHIPKRSRRSPSDLEGQGMDHGNGNVGNTARLSRESSCRQLLAHPLGDFPQDKTHAVHIEHRGQGAIGLEQHSVFLLPRSLSV